jgi:hypothetical protein
MFLGAIAFSLNSLYLFTAKLAISAQRRLPLPTSA